MAHLENYEAAVQEAMRQIDAERLSAGQAAWPDEDTYWELVGARARRLFPAFEAEPQSGWRVESLEPHVPYRRSLIDPEGRVYAPEALLTVAQVAQIRGVSKRRVQQWGERIGLTPLGSQLVTTVSAVLGFKPKPVGRPRT